MGYKEGGRLDWVRGGKWTLKKLYYHLRAYEWLPRWAYLVTAETVEEENAYYLWHAAAGLAVTVTGNSLLVIYFNVSLGLFLYSRTEKFSC